MGICICKLFSLNSKSKSGLEKNENNTILLVCLMSSFSRLKQLIPVGIIDKNQIEQAKITHA